MNKLKILQVAKYLYQILPISLNVHSVTNITDLISKPIVCLQRVVFITWVWML